MYGIAEWYGQPFPPMSPTRRQALAEAVRTHRSQWPVCPFQSVSPRCTKKGGVCSLRPYRIDGDRLGEASGPPTITCPSRFAEDELIPRWLAEIAGFGEIFVAREVPFMKNPVTGRAAGRIDLVVSRDDRASQWYGLELQAVYFSGGGMDSDFDLLRTDTQPQPPAPTERRRPDWRSSSAKRLMPQLQIKARLLRRWGIKLAVAVDMPFFQSIGGPSVHPSTDVNDGTIIWLVPEIAPDHTLRRAHWEVLSLEASSTKLLAAETINRAEFERTLRAKLEVL